MVTTYLPSCTPGSVPAETVVLISKAPSSSTIPAMRGAATSISPSRKNMTTAPGVGSPLNETLPATGCRSSSPSVLLDGRMSLVQPDTAQTTPAATVSIATSNVRRDVPAAAQRTRPISFLSFKNGSERRSQRAHCAHTGYRDPQWFRISLEKHL